MWLTDEERAILEAIESPDKDAAAGEPDSGEGSQPPEEAPAEPAPESTGEGEAEESGEVVVKAKDGKHEIPYEVLKELREENKRLKAMLEELAAKTQAPPPQPPEEDRWEVDPTTGEKYLKLDKATDSELVAARAKALEDGNFALVNAIDLEYQKRVARAYVMVSLYETSKAEFAARNPWFGKDPVLTKMAEDAFLQLSQDPQWRDRSPKEGWEEVERRLKPYVPVDRDQLEKEIMARILEKLGKGSPAPPPPTLSNMGGKPEATSPDKFADLDALLAKDPLAYERAILRMSQEEYEAYKRRR